MFIHTLLPILLGLLSFSIAHPTDSASIDPEYTKAAKRAVGLKLAEIVERETRAGRTLDIEGLLTPQERQLLGGGSQYAPYQVPCPTGWSWVRSADPDRTPVIGFALSGGGYRAMQVGLGGVMGTMNKSSEAASSGTGGWLDGVTYQAGLSGGSWGTGSFMANNGMLPTDLINQVWNLESNLVAPDDGKVSFYYNMISNVRAKANAGGGRFRTQITDYWSLALGDHLLPSQYHLSGSPNYTFSQLPTTVPALQNGSLPMPIIIAAEREPGEFVVPENASVYEMTPWEFGSWAFGSERKVRGAFTPIEYLGSSINAGQLNTSTCWKGFDQMSFTMGTSSTLFSAALVQLTAANSSSIFVEAIESLLKDISGEENDVALYPNSFAGWNPSSNPITNFTYITLVDAGLTNQNIPLEPLLIPYRNVDTIVAFDSSADTTYSWPNGTAMRTTYERSLRLAQTQDVAIRMPTVPSINGFVNGGLNTRPVFFGCNNTGTGNGSTPLVVYVPNYPWSYYGNTSTFQLEYNPAQSTNVVLNGMRSLTLNGTVPSWPKCFACAMADRGYSTRPADCQTCFNTWCWDGTDNTTAPSTDYQPIIGTVPQFIRDRNLGQAGAAPAGTTTGGSTVAQSSAPAASSSRAAGRRGVGSIGKGWLGLTICAASVLMATTIIA